MVQELSKLVRHTIMFNGESSIELDYSGLHARMLYHLKGIEFDGDPYALWGPWKERPSKKERKTREAKTDQAKRLMAKVCLNAMINAVSDAAAVSACNKKMDHHCQDPVTGETRRKTGKSWQDAVDLYNAYTLTGIKFSEVAQLVRKTHPSIADGFGNDMGIRLMRKDSRIALNVLRRFAKRGVPCLPCHDSFVVPISHRNDLMEHMIACYRKEMNGFLPIVK